MLKITKCGECLFFKHLIKDNTTYCGLSQTTVTNEDYCSKAIATGTELIKCEICGKELRTTEQILDRVEDKFHVICDSCLHFMGSCHTCDNATDCDFESNPSPLPKIIQKQVRQGNMIASMPVRNPERVAITCKKGCPCWIDNHCSREENNQTCKNYKQTYTT